MPINLVPLTVLAEEALNAGNFPRADLLAAQAATLNPNNPEPWLIRSQVAIATRNFPLAEQYLQHADQLSPNRPLTLLEIAYYCEIVGRPQDSLAFLRRALDAPPSPNLNISELTKLGTHFLAFGYFIEAEDPFRRVLADNPMHGHSLHSLAISLMNQSRWDEALPFLQRADSLDHRSCTLLSDLGLTFMHVGRFDESDQTFQRALRINPQHGASLANRGVTLLTLGRTREGLAHYESRVGSLTPPPGTPPPRWDGRLTPNLRLLLRSEQGLGDSIQFCRYIPLLASGLQITLQVPDSLVTLLQTLEGNTTVLPQDTPAPNCDAWLPLLSLPHFIDPDFSQIPTHVPYLHPNPAKVAAWSERLKSKSPERKIGIAWAGLPINLRDRARSTTLETFRPLFSLPNTKFISIQKGPAAEQLAAFPKEKILNAGPDLQDFSDTAALLQNLDLLISVDTSVVHLAGALARPVYTLLPFSPDWRWQLYRNDTPWYPTMRLFRQPTLTTPGNYTAPIAEILKTLTAKK